MKEHISHPVVVPVQGFGMSAQLGSVTVHTEERRDDWKAHWIWRVLAVIAARMIFGEIRDWLFRKPAAEED